MDPSAPDMTDMMEHRFGFKILDMLALYPEHTHEQCMDALIATEGDSHGAIDYLLEKYPVADRSSVTDSSDIEMSSPLPLSSRTSLHSTDSPPMKSLHTSYSSYDESDNDMDIGVFPTEIWQIICSQLKYENLTSIRLASRGLADIAAEYLITRVRFFTSSTSLQRLENIANHNLLRKNVRTLVYEASLLADSPCIHNFFAHYDLEHHKADKPQPPPEMRQTERAMRLYERNMKKFEQDLTAKWNVYREKYHTQQKFLDGPIKVALKNLPKFPNLREVQLRTDARCHHVLSDRFMQEFGRDCAVPMEADSAPTVWQLEYLLQNNLESLTAKMISADFFRATTLHRFNKVTTAFKTLRSVDLVFRLDTRGALWLADDPDATPFEVLDNGILSQALEGAHGLEELSVTFMPGAISRPATDLKNIVGSSSWPKLKQLVVDFVASTQEDFLAALRRQPSLTRLELGFCHLVEGDWIETLKLMRQDLKLEWFWTSGVLEDEHRVYPVEVCDRNMWIDDREKHQLCMSIDGYVTHQDRTLEEEEEDEVEDYWYNPLSRFDDDYEEEEDLIADYGPIEDSDLDDSDHTDDSGDHSEDDTLSSLHDAEMTDADEAPN